MFRRIIDSFFLAAILFLALIGGTSLFSKHCEAAELTPEQARGIYAVAYGQYGGPRAWLDHPPHIHIAKQADLCAAFGRKPECAVRGYYLKGAVHILDMDFSSAYNASILLHEFIHHFQYMDGKLAEDCKQWLENERQAFMIQINVLEKAKLWQDARMVRMSMRGLVCI